MVGAARRFPAAINESVVDLGDGTVVVRHFNVDPATQESPVDPATPENPMARVSGGHTYFHMPKVIAVDPKDGRVLSTVGRTSLWPACHELALGLEDQLWTREQHAAHDAEWREVGRSDITASRRAPIGLGNADEKAPLGLSRVEAGNPWTGATMVAKLVGRDTGVFQLPGDPAAAVAVIRAENSAGNVVGIATQASSAADGRLRPDLYGAHGYEGGPAGELVRPHNPHGKDHPAPLDGHGLVEHFRGNWTMKDLPEGAFALGQTGHYLATVRREGPSYDWFTTSPTDAGN
jgi:hypothetical protein